MNSPLSARPPAHTDAAPGPYLGTGVPHEPSAVVPAPPPWRTYAGGPDLAPAPDDAAEAERRLGTATRAALGLQTAAGEVAAVNAALALRKPLLVTGPPGVGRSALAFRIARELGLGRVLHWTVTGASVLRDALYAARPTQQGGTKVRLGPLGTALLPYGRPRVLLVEGLDRGDFDLPVELRAVLRRGGFDIPELADEASARVMTDDPGVPAPVARGAVACHELPITVITAGRTRVFPADFMADCLHWEHPVPTAAELTAAVRSRAGITDSADPRLLTLVTELAEAWSDDPRALGGLTVTRALDAVTLAAAVPWPPDETPDAVAARLLGLLRGPAREP
ncbi:AAA family ATPase [Streptomyces sp. NPDC055189]